MLTKYIKKNELKNHCHIFEPIVYILGEQTYWISIVQFDMRATIPKLYIINVHVCQIKK